MNNLFLSQIHLSSLKQVLKALSVFKGQAHGTCFEYLGLYLITYYYIFVTCSLVEILWTSIHITSVTSMSLCLHLWVYFVCVGGGVHMWSDRVHPVTEMFNDITTNLKS